jgi:broad specificity phosphatase PhoE
MGNRTRSVVWKAAAAIVATLFIGACSSSPHARTITLTFVRHAESQANADGVIDTDIPGPGLTPLGEDQAEQIAHQLGRNKYDGIFASTMVRTQQTAAPLAQKLGKQVQVLPGLREINAGWFQDKPNSMAKSTYLVAPADWLNGDLGDAIPGSVTGKQFNDQFTAAVQKIYDSGLKNPVAFSHAESIMYWTLLNVSNPNDHLVDEHPLPNIGRIVVKGSPVTGWTMVDWDGIRDFKY